MIAFPPGALPLAIAGVAAAAAPILIHLFNKARFREVDWGAMDFLLEAAKRSRSLLRFRDLWLLVLRTAAVVLFGLAVARPFLRLGGSGILGATAGRGPIHAILVVDNSMSMGRERLGGRTLLDDAKDRAKVALEQLPTGSRASVIPLCGPAGSYSLDPLRTREDAVEVIDAIRLVDRAGTVAQVVDLATQAAERVVDLADKRIVFLGDQQIAGWPADVKSLLSRAEGPSGRPPLDMQAVAVAVPETDNTWVESLAVVDGVADVELPATLTAVVRHEGREPRRDVQVSLVIDGSEVATDSIDLEPGQAREVTFSHLFDASPEPDRPAWATAMVVLPEDAIRQDDRRCLVVPVVSSLPVVFVDQYGEKDEDPRRGRLGETRSVRRLLAPVTIRDSTQQQLVRVKHLTVQSLDEEALQGVGLAVVAGVRSPGAAVPLLRSFVERGGQLVIAAGGDFDPAEWTAAAWLDGAGILPAPLGETSGRLPDESGTLEPRRLAWNSMRDEPLFRVPDVPAEELADLYGGPLFFKTVVTDIAAAPARAAAAEGTPAAGGENVDPSFRPRVLAAFDDGTPFLVTRRIGKGSVAWLASGLTGPWNTLAKTNAMLLCDRLLRGMLADTLPAHTIPSVDRFTLPVAAGDRRATLKLTQPDETGNPAGIVESLTVEAVGGDAYGATLRDLSRRGLYMVTATKPLDPAARARIGSDADADADAEGRKPEEELLWRQPLAVNGQARESEPAVFDSKSFSVRHADIEGLRWIGPDDAIEFSGARVVGHDAWWWMLAASGLCLIGESLLLATPREGRS
jgi:hypothetical protein